MSLYTFSFENKTEIGGGYDCLETTYHVPAENFDAVLLEDNDGRLAVQPWVFDDLKSRHPDVEECYIYVKYYETEHEFDIWTHYEITVMEKIGP